MKRTWIVVLAVAMLMAGTALAAEWNLVKNVKRLEAVSPDYKNDKDIDKKFIDLLSLTEKTKAEAEVYADVKRITAIPALTQSKYMDSFLYYMYVRSLAMPKTAAADQDSWLQLLKAHEASPHLLAAQLLRLRTMPKQSKEAREEVQRLVDWIKAQKPTIKVRPPEYAGNIVMGYKPRWNFADMASLKLYTLSYYMAAVTAPEGFLEDDTYISLLSRIKDGREDVLTEMAGIYRKMGRTVEASNTLSELAALKAAAKDYAGAKTVLDDAVRLNPENAAAVKERDRIKLELTYQALAPAPPVEPAIPEDLKAVERYLVPIERVVTAADLEGKSKGELRVMRNEVFARHGKIFQSADLDAYFSAKPWYMKNTAFSETAFTDIDRENVRVIKAAEELAK